MSSWEYYWTAENGEDLETRQSFPYLLYMRTRWEDTADGMSKPHSELLGFICFRQAEDAWDVYVPHHNGLYERTESLILAKQAVETHQKHHYHDG